MYQYVIVFFSTVILTATITRWFYVKKYIPKIMPITPAALTNPSNIPTLSLDRHNEYMRLMAQCESNKTNPPLQVHKSYKI
jgi:hypothetical protein